MNSLDPDFTGCLELLKNNFNNRISLHEKRPGIMQLLAPFFHEDGDMVDIFIEASSDPQKVRISDYGMTLMRLSYSYQIDTSNNERIFQRIVNENSLLEDDGKIYLDVAPQNLTNGIFQFAQTVAKISNMRHFSREVVRSLFYETLNDFIFSNLNMYKPLCKVNPLPSRDDLEVDYAFQASTKPLYLFGVRGVLKARLAAICCLEFQRANLPFRSIIVHEDFENLPKNDRARLTSAADKQFVDIEDFKQNSAKYFEREAV